MAKPKHPAATGTEIHRPFRWTFANAAARNAYNVGAAFADDVGCLAWQTDDNSVWLAKATGTGSSKWQQIGVALDINGLATEGAPTAGMVVALYNGTTNKKATLSSLLAGVMPVGGYVGELLIWNGTAWVVATAGLISATTLSPRSTDANSVLELTSGGGRLHFDTSGPLAELLAPTGSDLLLSCKGLGQQTRLQVQNTAGTRYDAIIATVVHPDSSDHVRLGFFGASPQNIQTIGGGGGVSALESIRAALAAYGLVVDNASVGDWTYSAPFSQHTTSPITVRNIQLPDNSFTSIEYLVECRDTGNNWFCSRTRVNFTRAAGGTTVLQNIEFTYSQGTLVANAPVIVDGANGVNARVAGKASADVDGFYRIRVETVLQAAAT